MTVCRSDFSMILRTRVSTAFVFFLALSAMSVLAEEALLVGVDSECEYLIPSIDNGGAELTTGEWSGIATPPNSKAWKPGKLGIGFAPHHDPYYLVFLRHDVREEMRGFNASLWARAEFSIDASDLSEWRYLDLQMRFDDGFIVYLNGVAIASFNAPDQPMWNSAATAAVPDAVGSVPMAF